MLEAGTQSFRHPDQFGHDFRGQGAGDVGDDIGVAGAGSVGDQGVDRGSDSGAQPLDMPGGEGVARAFALNAVAGRIGQQERACGDTVVGGCPGFLSTMAESFVA